MTATKYGKYIIEDDRGRPEKDCRDQDEFQRIMPTICNPVTYLDNKMVDGNFYLECMWYHSPSEASIGRHTHDFDEVLGFYGSNPADYHDLGAEVELWLGDEKHLLTRSCTVFVPAGLEHCPLVIRRVDRPFFHFSGGAAKAYDKTAR